MPVAIVALVWEALVLFVLVTPGDSAVPTLIVAGLILTGGAYFAFLRFAHPDVLDTEPGEDLFAAAPQQGR